MDRFSERAAAYKRQVEGDKEPGAKGKKKSQSDRAEDSPASQSASEQIEAVQRLLKGGGQRGAPRGGGGGSTAAAGGAAKRSGGAASEGPRAGADANRRAEPGAEQQGRTRAQKAARFLLLLGKEEAANVLKHLDDAEVEEIVGEISRINRIDREEAEELLSEFRGFIKTGPETWHGGPHTAKRMLAAAFGSDRAEELYAQAEKKHTGPLDFLNDLEDSQLVSLLQPESTAVQALVLVMIERRKAAHLLSHLPEEGRPQLVARMARMQKIDYSVLERIAEAMREKVRSHGRIIEDEVQGRAVLSQILRTMGNSEGQDLLEEIAQTDPDLAQQMRDELFTVDTVLDIEDRGLQEVLADMSDHEIALVLKGKEERFRAKILENVSANRRRVISETYSHLGAVSKGEVDRASNEFLRHLRRLEEQGKLIVRTDDDEYI